MYCLIHFFLFLPVNRYACLTFGNLGTPQRLEGSCIVEGLLLVFCTLLNMGDSYQTSNGYIDRLIGIDVLSNT